MSDECSIDIQEAENWRGFFSFIPNQVFEWLIHCPCKIICLFTGNQFGKNEAAMMDYTLRFLGLHPIDSKNLHPDDPVRIFRFASETLPNEKVEDEVKNTQYPVLKRRLPPQFMEKDITARKPIVTLKTDMGKCQVEFVSFGQEVQAGAGVQRKSVWIDEECNRDFFEEQVPRLLASDGDILFTFTPVVGSIGWAFDYLYERARLIYRTKHVRDWIRETEGEDVPEVETRDSKYDIAIIMAATDDNPIYENLAKRKSERTGVVITAKEYIDEMYSMIDDEDVIGARRYGQFKRISGRIYKKFTTNVHRIRPHMWFPSGLPYHWKHVRTIDYHQSNPWAVAFLMRSPENELFVYNEYSPNPQKLTTYSIAETIRDMSRNYKFSIDLIDPLASIKMGNKKDGPIVSTVDDLNRYFNQFKKAGEGTGAYWRPFDTKVTRGREEMNLRLSNSIKCKHPFNNKVVIDNEIGMKETVYLPTIWFFDTCPQAIESMNRWRLEEWGSREALMKNEEKETPQKKYSHFPTALEGVLKSPSITTPRYKTGGSEEPKPKHYFQRAV